MASKVTVTYIDSNKDKSAIENVFRALCIEKSKEEKVISIKINLCDYRMAESGATTDPYLLERLIQVLRCHYPNSIINILENDASSVEADSLFALLGFKNTFGNYNNVNLVNVANHNWVRKTIPQSHFFEDLEIPEILDKSDIFINFAKLKINTMTKTTGCLKNNFGLIREKKKSIYHNVINKVIADINQVIKTDICIVDGLIGMEGLGPAFGTPKKCNLLIAGKDPVSVDACCARIMGFRPSFVKHILLCNKCGIGSMHYSLETDIPDFSYRDYTFKFSHIDYFARTVIRRLARLGVAG